MKSLFVRSFLIAFVASFLAELSNRTAPEEEVEVIEK